MTWLSVEEYISRCCDGSSGNVLQLANCTPDALRKDIQDKVEKMNKQLRMFENMSIYVSGAPVDNPSVSATEVTVHGLGTLSEDATTTATEEFKGTGQSVLCPILCHSEKNSPASTPMATIYTEGTLYTPTIKLGEIQTTIARPQGVTVKLHTDAWAGALILKVSDVTEETMAKQCAACGITQETDMNRCSRCKKVRYCSRECQAADWEKHKKVCKKVKQ